MLVDVGFERAHKFEVGGVRMGTFMPKSIVQLNIERFRRLLSETTAEKKRRIIEKLLIEEEAKRATRRPDAKRGGLSVDGGS